MADENRSSVKGSAGEWEEQSPTVRDSSVAVATRTAIELEELKKKVGSIQGLRKEVEDLSGIVHDNAKALPGLRDGLNQCQDAGD